VAHRSCRTPETPLLKSGGRHTSSENIVWVPAAWRPAFARERTIE
jgi:hypothetical protein